MDEELVAALLSLDDNQNLNQESSNDDSNNDHEYRLTNTNDGGGEISDLLQYDTLPEIEVDFDDNLGDFLELDHLDTFFDDTPREEGETTQSPLPLSEAIFEIGNDIDRDEDTEQLHLDLAHLTIGQESPDNKETAALDSKTEDSNHSKNIQDNGDEALEEQFPFFLYCQPCTDQPSDFSPLRKELPSITEDRPLSDKNAQVERRPTGPQDQDLDELLQFSLLSLATDEDKNFDINEVLNDNSPLLFDEMEPTWDQQQTNQQPLSPGYQSYYQPPHQGDPVATNIIHPQTVEAADFFVDAFENKERTCLGHKETIFGVTFSECGKFCATASQDSTIAIWDVQSNALITKLQKHSKDHECLRVAWASAKWSHAVLDRHDQGNYAHLLASAGADGKVMLWACQDPKRQKGKTDGGWKCIVTLDHAELLGRGNKTKDKQESEDEAKPTEDDKPQVYALQFIDHWKAFTKGENGINQNSFLMTSSDDYIHLWDVEVEAPSPEPKIVVLDDKDDYGLRNDEEYKISVNEVMSLHFEEFHHYGYGVSVCSVTKSGLLPPSSSLPSSQRPVDSPSSSNEKGGGGFGGDRNPDNMIFVFDAAYCNANGLLGIALSDGSLRLVNGRGICVSILHLPGCQSHLTSFCWDSTGTRLATSVATGHLITWTLDFGRDNSDANEAYTGEHIVATCSSIMEGGHQAGRPLFGSRFCGTGKNSDGSSWNDLLLVSWGVDGRLCIWDSYAAGNVYAPLAILRDDNAYPIYAVELSSDHSALCLGGGSEGGFLGVPMYLYDVEKQLKSTPNTSTSEAQNDESNTKENEEENSSKHTNTTNTSTGDNKKQPESETAESSQTISPLTGDPGEESIEKGKSDIPRDKKIKIEESVQNGANDE